MSANTVKYTLNDWEGQAVDLPTGQKITVGEVRAAVCRKNGMSQKEAARELHCSPNNINRIWQSLYYKLHTSDVVIALDKLIDIGALARITLGLILSLSISPLFDTNDEQFRRTRSRRNSEFTAIQLPLNSLLHV